MSQGLVLSTFFYPRTLGLDIPSEYLLEVDEKPAIVRLVRHIRAVEILSIENELIFDENLHSPQLRKPVPTTITSHTTIAFFIKPEQNEVDAITTDTINQTTYRSQRLTEIAIIYEIDDSEPIEPNMSFLQHVFNNFVHAYRLVTKDMRIRQIDKIQDLLVAKNTISIYTDQETTLPTDQRLKLAERPHEQTALSTLYSPIEPISFQHDITNATNKLVTFLKQKSPISPGQELLTRAIEAAYYTENTRLAALEAFVAAEVTTSTIVRNLKIAKGASKTKLADLEKDLTISYKLNIDLPILLDTITKREREIIGKVDNVRQLRNNIVHKGITPTITEARESIQAVTEFMDMLTARGLTT